MPNWVSNRITVEGNKTIIDKFAAQASAKPITRWAGDEREVVLSFANFIAPPQEAIDSGEYHAPNGWDKESGRTGDTENNWYNFNNREWGTKWDAVEVSLEWLSDTELYYGFDTAWGHPEPIFKAMTEEFPMLDFTFSWLEEQGWGGEAIGQGGLYEVTEKWGIPDSHSDYAERSNEQTCICAYEDDQNEWYEDCPRPEADPKTEKAEKLRQQIIEKTGVSKEWADKHLEVII